MSFLKNLFLTLGILVFSQVNIAHALDQTLVLRIDESSKPIKVQTEHIALDPAQDSFRFCVQNNTTQNLKGVSLNRFTQVSGNPVYHPLKNGVDPEVGVLKVGAIACSTAQSLVQNKAIFKYNVEVVLLNGSKVTLDPLMQTDRTMASCGTITLGSGFHSACGY